MPIMYERHKEADCVESEINGQERDNDNRARLSRNHFYSMGQREPILMDNCLCCHQNDTLCNKTSNKSNLISFQQGAIVTDCKTCCPKHVGRQQNDIKHARKNITKLPTYHVVSAFTSQEVILGTCSLLHHESSNLLLNRSKPGFSEVLSSCLREGSERNICKDNLLNSCSLGTTNNVWATRNLKNKLESASNKNNENNESLTFLPEYKGKKNFIKTPNIPNVDKDVLHSSLSQKMSEKNFSVNRNLERQPSESHHSDGGKRSRDKERKIKDRSHEIYLNCIYNDEDRILEGQKYLAMLSSSELNSSAEFEGNTADLSSSKWTHTKNPSHLFLPASPSSAFRKKTSICSPARKQRVKFDLDVEIHLVPRDSGQSTPIGSTLDLVQSDGDSLVSTETDCESESNVNFTFSRNTLKENCKAYSSANTEPNCDLKPSEFGKLSINTSISPFRAIKREDSEDGKNFFTISGGRAIPPGRRDSLDILQMQHFLKQQAKERALSASLPCIFAKKDARKSIKMLQDQFRTQHPNSNNDNSASSNRETSFSRKRFVSSFSSYSKRKSPTYAHLQLQKQYHDWEQRRKSKKKSDEEISSDSQRPTNVASSAASRNSNRTNRIEQLQDQMQNFENSTKETSISKNVQVQNTYIDPTNSQNQFEIQLNSPRFSISSDTSVAKQSQSPPATLKEIKTISSTGKFSARRLLNTPVRRSLSSNSSSSIGKHESKASKRSYINVVDKTKVEQLSESESNLIWNERKSYSIERKNFEAGTPSAIQSIPSPPKPNFKDVHNNRNSTQSRNPRLTKNTNRNSEDVPRQPAPVSLKTLGLTVHPPKIVNQRQYKHHRRKDTPKLIATKSPLPSSSGQIFSLFQSQMATNAHDSRNKTNAIPTLCNARKNAPNDNVLVLAPKAIA